MASARTFLSDDLTQLVTVFADDDGGWKVFLADRDGPTGGFERKPLFLREIERDNMENLLDGTPTWK